jgi:hypothetical protein
MRLLAFCPTARLDEGTVRAIVNQVGVEFFDVMFTYDNPWKFDDRGNVMRNVQIAYEKMTRLVLSEGYDKVWIVESDIIPQADALKKLLEVDADVVSGLYVHRGHRHSPNLFDVCQGDDFGPPLTWDAIRAKWGQTIPISGGCQGCLLVDRRTLEGFSFRNEERAHGADLDFMAHCQKKGFEQMAQLDVCCGHANDNGEIYWPDKENGYRTELKGGTAS